MKYVDKEDVSWDRMWKNYRNLLINMTGSYFFGGAGVSTESGIPDFRSVDGLYNQKYDYPPETILSHTFLCGIRKNFTAFTGIRCWHWMQSRMRHIKTVGTGGGGKAYRCGDTEH